MSCPQCPLPPPPCPQQCYPPPGSTALSPPIMRGMHRAMLARMIPTALVLSFIGGLAWYTFVGATRKRRYKEYYRVTDLGEMEDEMYRKGLFQFGSPVDDEETE